MIEKGGGAGRSGKSKNPRHALRVNILSDWHSNRRHCAACGVSLPTSRATSGAVLPMCEGCEARNARGERVKMLFAERRRHAEPRPPEERFGGLFESARVLLKERAGEDVVLPTLAMEGLIIKDGEFEGWAKVKRSLLRAWGDADAWEAEKARLAERPGTVVPVKVVGDAVIMKRVPLVVRVVRGDKRLEGIVIELTPGKPPESEEVVEAYERALEDSGLSAYHERAASIDLVFNDYQIRIGLKPRPVYMGFGHEGAFPAPYIFKEIYEGIASGPLGSRSVQTRASGGSMAPDNGIPAVVAIFLKIYGQATWKQVYRLINQRVLRGTWKSEIPENELELNYESRTKQLKTGAKAVRRHLVPIMRSLT